jgi:hypothetical protein
MRRAILSAVCVLIAAAAGFGQTTSVTLQNQESSPFWFAVDPPELSEVSVGSMQLTSRVEQFFASEGEEFPFQSLAPDAQTTLTGLAQGSHLLVGFFAVEGDDVLPVRAFSVQVDAGSGDRFYALFSGPALLSIGRDTGRLKNLAQAQGGMTVAPEAEAPVEGVVSPPEGEAAVEVAVEEPALPEQVAAPIASFSPTYDPVVFTRESTAGFTVLPISQSRFWGEAGTRLESLDGVLRDGLLRLTLNAADGFSPHVSYFFYLFGTRRLGKENAVTVEILPLAREGKGACVLWERTASAAPSRPVPSLLGTTGTVGRTCLVEIRLEDLPAEAFAELGENPSMDLCSCRYDSQKELFEEYYFTTLQLADFPSATAEAVTR